MKLESDRRSGLLGGEPPRAISGAEMKGGAHKSQREARDGIESRGARLRFSFNRRTTRDMFCRARLDTSEIEDARDETRNSTIASSIQIRAGCWQLCTHLREPLLARGIIGGASPFEIAGYP